MSIRYSFGASARPACRASAEGDSIAREGGEVSRVLVVDDDPHIRELLRHFLEADGLEVSEAEGGASALAFLKSIKVDLVVLDLMMPGLDGWTVCKEIKRRRDTPVLLLTAKGESSQKVRGFELGADDYVVKPFDPPELVARVKSLLRRFRAESSQSVQVGSLLLDRLRFEAMSDGEAIALPRKEFDLLFKLASSPGRTFSRDELIRDVWGEDFDGNERTLDVHVNRIRDRFGGDGHGFRITTIRGLGYRLEALAEEPE
jgi:two-component system, OmpR family, response regulator